jgi:hypothetical protein
MDWKLTKKEGHINWGHETNWSSDDWGGRGGHWKTNNLTPTTSKKKEFINPIFYLFFVWDELGGISRGQINPLKLWWCIFTKLCKTCFSKSFFFVKKNLLENWCSWNICRKKIGNFLWKSRKKYSEIFDFTI